jgi:hypothetical protein
MESPLQPKSLMLSKMVSTPNMRSYSTLSSDFLGFNMGNDLAIFVTYAAFLVDGNLITNLLSIGGKSSATGPDLPAPAIVGGLDTHAVFEGDASTTRGT